MKILPLSQTETGLHLLQALQERNTMLILTVSQEDILKTAVFPVQFLKAFLELEYKQYKDIFSYQNTRAA